MEKDKKPIWLKGLEKDSSEDLPKLLSMKELAEMFKVSIPTIYSRLKSKKKLTKKNSIDFRKIPDCWIGEKRFFLYSTAKKLYMEMIEKGKK